MFPLMHDPLPERSIEHDTWCTHSNRHAAKTPTLRPDTGTLQDHIKENISLSTSHKTGFQLAKAELGEYYKVSTDGMPQKSDTQYKGKII